MYDTFSRLLEASEAESLREVPVHPQPGGGDHLHLLSQGSDPGLRTPGHRQRDHWTPAWQPW